MNNKEQNFINGFISRAEIYSYLLFVTVMRCVESKEQMIDNFLLEYDNQLGHYFPLEQRKLLEGIKKFYISPINIKSFEDHLLWLPRECFFSLPALEILSQEASIGYTNYVENAQHIFEFKLKKSRND